MNSVCRPEPVRIADFSIGSVTLSGPKSRFFVLTLAVRNDGWKLEIEDLLIRGRLESKDGRYIFAASLLTACLCSILITKNASTLFGEFQGLGACGLMSLDILHLYELLGVGLSSGRAKEASTVH